MGINLVGKCIYGKFNVANTLKNNKRMICENIQMNPKYSIHCKIQNIEDFTLLQLYL